MNDKLEQLYNLYKQNGIIQSTDFNTFASANENQRRKLYDLGKQQGLFNTTDFNTFNTAFQPVKKKETTVSPSVQKPKPISSGTQPKVTQKPSGTSVSGKPEGLYSAPGNELAVFKKTSDGWYVDNNRSGNFIKLQKGDVEKRVAALEKNAKKLFDADYEKSLTWKAQPQPKVEQQRTKQTQDQKQAQQLFENTFKALDADDPIVVEKNKISELSSDVSTYVDKSEAQTVEDLTNKFKGTKYDIFDFEETGWGDMLKVTNRKTGQDIVIDLDGSENEKKILQSFIESNLSFREYNDLVERRNNINKELLSPTLSGLNQVELEKELSDINKKIKEQEIYRKGYALSKGTHAAAAMYGKQKIKDIDQQFNDNVSRLIGNSVVLKEEAAKNLEFEKKLKQDYSNGIINKEQYNEILNDKSYQFQKQQVQDRYNELTENAKSIKEDRDLMEKVVAEARTAKEERGDIGSNILANFAYGFVSPYRMLAQAQAYTKPVYDSKGNRLYDQEVLSKEAFQDILPGVITDEYITSEKRSDFEKAIAGVAESLGAVAAIPIGGGAAKVSTEAVKRTGLEIVKNLSRKALLSPSQLGLFASSYMNFKDQINSDPETAKIDEADKVLLSGAYAYVSSKLESFGMSKWFTRSPAGTKVTSYVMSKVFKDLPKDATQEMIDNRVNSSVKALIAKGAISLTTKGNVEGTTEALQELADITLKSAYNEMKGEEIFQNPSFPKIVDRMAESYKLGLIGGTIMSSTSQILSTAKESRTAIQLKQLENIISDPNLKKMFEDDVKVRVLSGEITKEQGESELREINDSASIMNEIPDYVKDKTESFKLISEKRKIEKEIAGKDESLIATQKARIAEIDNQLKTIGENAVKESTKPVEEGPAEGGGIQREGAQEGQPEVREGERPVGQTAQPSPDLGDRAVEGRGVQEALKDIDSTQNALIEKRNTTGESVDLKLINQDVWEQLNKGQRIDQIVSEAYHMAKEDGSNPELVRAVEDILTAPNETVSTEQEQKIITNLDQKINQYETEQAAEGIGAEETVTTDEGKEIKRTKFRAPKNANTKEALAIETGTNPRAAVLKYFISGGKINSTAIQKLFGDKQGKPIKGEVQNRLSLIDNKKGKTPEQIAEYLWMQYGNQFKMTDADFIPFVEEVISEFKGTRGMVNEILSYENKTEEDYYKQKYGDDFEGYDISELEDAESVLDYMTDEEIIQMSNEIEAAEAEFAKATEIVAPEDTLEDLKTLDVTDKTNLQKVQSFLDKLDKDIDKFGKETLGVNLPVAVAKAVIKTLKTLVDAGVSLEQALKQAAEIHNVSEVDIVDSFEKVRQKETEASKAAKKISRPTQKKVVVNEAVVLRDQLRLEARAARESVMDLKRKQRALVAVVNGMKRSGSINTTQATALAKRIVNTNIDNPVMVKRMLDYAGRLFQDAEYKNKLSNARSINKKIKSAIKSKDLQASVVAVAKDFSKIDPRLLEDIDRYIENATKVLDAVKRTRLPEMREAMNFDDINAYTEEANAEMEEYRKEEVKELNDQLLESIDTEGMTAAELMDLIRSLSDVDAALPSEKKRAIILDYINKVKDAYTPIVESIVKGTDPFTGDSIDTSKKAKELIGKLIDIDINKLDVREAVKVIDAINNFITNGITDNVESIVRTYEGQVNAQEIADSNMPIREAKLGGIARLWSEQMMNLPVLADWIFKSPKRAIQVLNKMGFTDFQNGVAKSVKNWTNYVDSYHNTFKKKKANGKNFMDAENIYERGMYAFLKRTVAGDEIAQQKEFERKVGLISKSIDVLKKQGSQKDLKVAEMYEQLMDKFELNKDGVTISDVESKVDPINKDAVNWWINTWAENYGGLADVSQNVYNTVLGKDINYTPDKFSSLDVANSKQIEEMIDSMGGGGFAGALNYEYDKKTGVLMPSSKPVSMETGRYVNLNFDMNNSRALKAALVDINTAGATKQIKGFLKSDSWNNIIKNKEDRDLFRSRVDSYILASRNKRTATDEQALAAFERTMRAWASIGATRALGGIFQPVKQVVPVMVNTAINVGRNFSLAVTRDQYSWIDKIGMPISNRGIESMAAFEDADKEFENNVAIGAYTKAMSGIEALNKKWLKLVLSNPDVFAARSSFIAYYKQALRAKGMSADIDFTRPEDADQEALNYAQHMVDRQQNVSDAALMGDLFTSNQPLKKIIKNTLFPFMSFVINQKSRMVTDLATFSSKDVSTQEKINAFKSLSALTSEMAVFHSVSFAIKYYIVNAIVGAISDDEEDEEEVEKAMKRQFGYTVGTVAKDIFSPVPIATDKVVESGVDYLLDIIGKSALEDEAKLALKNQNQMLEDEYEDPITGDDAKEWIEKYIEDNRVKVQSYEAQGPGGVYRIAFDKFSELYDTYKLASEGSYESEGFAGKPITKYIDEQGREDIKEILPYYAAWSALGIPAEFGTIFRKYESKIKRENSLTEKQKEAEVEVLKTSKKEKLNDLEFALVKKLKGTTTQSGAERVIEELNWIKENGGVKGDKQIKKYIEILEANGEVIYDDLKKIQSIK